MGVATVSYVLLISITLFVLGYCNLLGSETIYKLAKRTRKSSKTLYCGTAGPVAPYPSARKQNQLHVDFRHLTLKVIAKATCMSYC